MATTLSPRSKRTLRTVIQFALGGAAAVPAVVAKLPLGADAGQALVVAALVTHYFHVIEALPFFPEWLKVAEPAGSTDADTPAADPAP